MGKKSQNPQSTCSWQSSRIVMFLDITSMSLQAQNSRKSRGNNKGKTKHHKPLKSSKSKAKGEEKRGVRSCTQIAKPKA